MIVKPDVTYAVGDVHGCSQKLNLLLDRCIQDCGGRTKHIVFLGDYIDRGPDSRGVVQTLIEAQRCYPNQLICLRGNHEAIMLDAARTGDHRLWFNNGGRQTLTSYGVRSAADLPAHHLQWIASLPLFHDDNRRFFVHAGVDPARPLASQREEDLLWIREPFLSNEQEYGRLIVHGHTPVPTQKPDLRKWRLNLDTGAAYGGPLTAAAFTDEQTGPSGFLNDLQ